MLSGPLLACSIHKAAGLPQHQLPPCRELNITCTLVWQPLPDGYALAAHASLLKQGLKDLAWIGAFSEKLPSVWPMML